MKIARVALDVPLEEAFDFRLPPDLDPPVGAFVVVPFGRSRKVGLVVERAEHSDVPAERLRDVESAVPDVGALTADQLELLDFCAQYYQRPFGETLAAALPPRLRQVRRRARKPIEAHPAPPPTVEGPALTEPQREAVDSVLEGFSAFHPVLLHGVTGSGKTEVYLRLVSEALARGRQALFLVPEIGLTPQLEAQVRERFPQARLACAHSHLSEGERAESWLAAQSGAAHIVLGTRLAVLMPFRALGLVIVDEEHDPSYKQQEGLRYSARDVAVRRAQRLGIPIVLGSATPSLETWVNAAEGRYRLATLPLRAVEGAAMPEVRTIDTRADRPHEGLSSGMVKAIRERIARGEQSLIFVNRRGYAPVLFCAACTWHSACTRCTANLVLHRSARQLRCHHCGHVERIPAACPSCGAADLAPVGHGSQRVEEALAQALPGARIARVDRDSTTRKGSLQDVFDRVRDGGIDVLVGTQMLAKGHDYPNLTLVGVLESDGALFSTDFRAAERLFALLLQVSGRSGRGRTAGEVLIQTDFPHHPLYAAVAAHDFARFAGQTLEERRLAGLPPFAHLALLRAEARKPGEAMLFLQRAAAVAAPIASGVDVFDPVPATLERKAGYERGQLLVRAASRAPLQRFLTAWRGLLAAEAPRTLRWSLDVDPQEV